MFGAIQMLNTTSLQLFAEMCVLRLFEEMMVQQLADTRSFDGKAMSIYNWKIVLLISN